MHVSQREREEREYVLCVCVSACPSVHTCMSVCEVNHRLAYQVFYLEISKKWVLVLQINILFLYDRQQVCLWVCVSLFLIVYLFLTALF